jgi:hypothetical protein
MRSEHYYQYYWYVCEGGHDRKADYLLAISWTCIFFVLFVIKTGISNVREPNCFSNNTPLLCHVILRVTLEPSWKRETVAYFNSEIPYRMLSRIRCSAKPVALTGKISCSKPSFLRSPKLLLQILRIMPYGLFQFRIIYEIMNPFRRLVRLFGRGIRPIQSLFLHRRA